MFENIFVITLWDSCWCVVGRSWGTGRYPGLHGPSATQSTSPATAVELRQSHVRFLLPSFNVGCFSLSLKAAYLR